MCKVLQLPRSTYYYESKEKIHDATIEAAIIKIFKESRSTYGIRKIKVELSQLGYQISTRRIGRIMKSNGLVSRYTIAQFKSHVDKYNESKTANLVKRNFKDQSPMHVVVSDLTYVCIGMSWHYICILIDLFNREIIGYSAGRK